MLNLIDHLPRNSHYIDAMASDPDAAEAYLEAVGYDEPAERAERFSDWSAEREALERIYDAVRVLNATLIAVHDGKPGPVEPVPRPVPEVVKLRKARSRADAMDWAQRFTPSRRTTAQ